MAGGKGHRLNPITKIFPKPLVPIKEKQQLKILLKTFQNLVLKIIT